MCARFLLTLVHGPLQFEELFLSPVLTSSRVAASCQIFAVHSRYPVFGFFRFLQGLGERPGPCKYYVSLNAVFLSQRQQLRRLAQQKLRRPVLMRRLSLLLSNNDSQGFLTRF